jgi:hypothetical protein
MAAAAPTLRSGLALGDTRQIMLNWLIGNCDLFGLPCQNWMWVFGGGLLIYIAVLVIAGRRQTNGHIR